MATTQTIPLSTEQLLNANQDTVRGQQVQLAEHADGFYYNETIAAGSVYADNELDFETDLGRKVSEFTIESESNDIRIKFDDSTRSDFKYIHKNRAYTLDKHKVTKLYIDNSLSAAVESVVRVDIV